MARPPGQLFQKMAQIKTEIKKNTIKYFLIFYLATELFSFIIYEYNPTLYYDLIYYILFQFQFFIMFLFLLRFNFCGRNKIIIYFLLLYFLSNMILPFVITNDIYSDFIKNITIILFAILLTVTIKSKNETLN